MAMEYRNLMEDIVLQNLDTVMAAEGGCTCDACKSDVVSYALNHLTPHYVATRQGRLMVKLQSYELQSRAAPPLAERSFYRKNSRSSRSLPGP